MAGLSTYRNSYGVCLFSGYGARCVQTKGRTITSGPDFASGVQCDFSICMVLHTVLDAYPRRSRWFSLASGKQETFGRTEESACVPAWSCKQVCSTWLSNPVGAPYESAMSYRHDMKLENKAQGDCTPHGCFVLCARPNCASEMA